MINHVGTCELETNRLYLRRFIKDDAEMAFKNWMHDEEVARYVAWPRHQTVETTYKVVANWERAYQSLTTYQWAIVLKENQEVIGSISLFNFSSFWFKKEVNCELGYSLSRMYWNQGFATEAAQAIVEFAFEVIGVTKVKARYDVRNEASGRVMQKIGMTYEGLLPKACQNGKKQWVDCHLYQLNKSDYLMSKDILS